MEKTLAWRLYGENDLRLETFELPALREDEILADVVSNSVCMSDHKAAAQGAKHKRVPKDIDRNPVIIGHEFCGTLLKVGRQWQDQFRPGQRYSVQPALSIPGREHEAPGYSFRYLGGDATKVIIPREVMERGCLLPYDGDAFFKASLAEPVSCIVGAFKSSYHFPQGDYTHQMGIVQGGTMVVLAGAGPMGLGAIDYALHGPRQPRRLVVTDIDDARLRRAEQVFSLEAARQAGVELHYVNTANVDPVTHLKGMNEGKGFDDVFVFAPVAKLVEQASGLLGFNGCMNFFAGPSRQDFTAPINFYDVHYSGHHIAGSSGGNTEDLKESLELMARGRLNPAVMVTHVGGMDQVAQTIINLPGIPGGKKLMYTNVALPLTAIEDFAKIGEKDPFFAELARIVGKTRNLWSTEAEAYLLKHARPMA